MLFVNYYEGMKQILDKIDLNTRTISSVFVLTVALINITPLCGFLFDCGCTWIWAGQYEHCNIHDVNALHRCPWCSSTIAGFLSVSSSIFAGTWMAFKVGRSDQNKFNINDFAIRSLSGLAVFLLCAFFAGWMSASIQDYPTFIISRYG